MIFRRRVLRDLLHRLLQFASSGPPRRPEMLGFESTWWLWFESTHSHHVIVRSSPAKAGKPSKIKASGLFFVRDSPRASVASRRQQAVTLAVGGSPPKLLPPWSLRHAPDRYRHSQNEA